MSMTPQSLVQLIKNNNMPSEFVEILVNSNGAYTSSVQYTEDHNTPVHIRATSTLARQSQKLTLRQGSS